MNPEQCRAAVAAALLGMLLGCPPRAQHNNNISALVVENKLDMEDMHGFTVLRTSYTHKLES